MYGQLRTDIRLVAAGTTEHATVTELFQCLPPGVSVKNVFKVSRPVESDMFAYDVAPHRLLLHGTHARNALGILQRGILLPKVAFIDYVHGWYQAHMSDVQVVTTLFNVERSDYGMLGAGAYFSPEPRVACAYCKSSPGFSTRVVFVAKVAIGRMYNTDTELPSTVEPPPGFDSVCGSPATPQHPTPFKKGLEVRICGALQWRWCCGVCERM